MIINAHKPSDWNATYLSATTPKVDITNYVDWFDNAPRYQAYRKSVKYSELELKILVEGTSSADKEKNISDLINEVMLKNNIDDLAETATIDLTAEKGYYFEGYYSSHSESIINQFASEITFTMIGQKLLAGQAITLTSGGNIEVNGNCQVPVNIEFDASGTGSATISINGTAYKMDVTEGSTYKINGINGLYTKDDEIDIVNYKSYAFPTLQSGTNSIVFTSGLISSMTLNWNGRLM